MVSGWDETGPRTRARARPLACGGGEFVVGGCFAAIFGSGGDGGIEAMV